MNVRGVTAPGAGRSADGAGRSAGPQPDPDPAGQRLLHATGLSVTAGPPGRGRTLVREVSLGLQHAQTLGIVGESGSGKSLTARALVGLLPAGLQARGSVTLRDAQLIGAPRRVMRKLRGPGISLLMQDPFTMLNPLQTTGTHVAESLPAAVRRDRAQARSEVRRRLAEVGLGPETAGRYPFQLSGGMRQRVALAAALGRDPEVLIADEPTTALDVTTQAEVLQLLKALQQRRGMALILITHDLRVAFSVCDQILVMYAGSVVEQAPARELMTVPAHPYSLSLLLAEPPVDHYLERLTAVPGTVPPADAVASTCGFAARCEWAQPGCTSARPQLEPAGPGRASACLRLDDICTQMQRKLAGHQRAGSAPAACGKGTAVASLTDVRKTYRPARMLRGTDTVTALDGVSVEILDGESVGLVGETGSGKTTIARTILGLAKPDSGAIRLGGIDASSYRALSREQLRQVRRTVQAVFQDPYSSLNPALSVGSTLREALAARADCADPRSEVADLLGQVGLPAAYGQRRPALLSGGERQRVAIARAIALRPRLLICDEPVAALDVSAQAQVLELLRDLRRRYGMSMLFITHDLSVVRQMADRIIVLYRGRIVEAGETAAVLGNPQNSYTRQLLEAVPGREAAGGEAQHQPPAGDGLAG